MKINFNLDYAYENKTIRLTSKGDFLAVIVSMLI